MFYELDGVIPEIADGSVWVAPDANVIGNVKLGPKSSVWFGVTIRGDNDPISIGEGSNIQDHSVLHTDPGMPLKIGCDVTVGHKVMLHGCTIGDNALIGMGSTILNGARIGAGSIVGAGSLVTEGKEFPEGVLIVGAPARVVRELKDTEKTMVKMSALHYQENASKYARGLKVITFS